MEVFRYTVERRRRATRVAEIPEDESEIVNPGWGEWVSSGRMFEMRGTSISDEGKEWKYKRNEIVHD